MLLWSTLHLTLVSRHIPQAERWPDSFTSTIKKWWIKPLTSEIGLQSLLSKASNLEANSRTVSKCYSWCSHVRFGRFWATCSCWCSTCLSTFGNGISTVGCGPAVTGIFNPMVVNLRYVSQASTFLSRHKHQWRNKWSCWDWIVQYSLLNCTQSTALETQKSCTEILSRENNSDGQAQGRIWV